MVRTLCHSVWNVCRAHLADSLTRWLGRVLEVKEFGVMP
jgi:hypothetical protein